MSSSMHMFVVVSLSVVFAVSVALPQSNSAYQFPSEADSILSNPPVKESFSCEGLAYGYYADVDNNCEIFHICLPNEETGDFSQWSFVCGNGTMFDQQTLTCNYPSDSFPCEEAASLYGAVEYGKVEE